MTILSMREFAKRANVSRATIMYHIKKGDIKTARKTTVIKGIPEGELEKLKKVVKYKQL